MKIRLQTNKWRLIWVSIALLIFLILTGIWNPIENIVRRFSTTPLEILSSSVGEGVESEKNIVNKEIKAKTESEFLREENQILRKELAIVEEIKPKTVTAQVIARPDVLPQALLILSKGRSDGIATGQYVTSQGVAVGQVAKVEERTSWVMLFNHPESKQPVEIIGKPDAKGVLKGSGEDFVLSIDLIPQNIEIEKDDIVIISNMRILGDRNNIYLGTVTQAIPDQQGLFQAVQVSPLIDYEKLSIVTIIM